MEHYTKGETIEVEIPPVFPPDGTTVEMRVNAGSKIRNLMGFAIKKIKENDTRKIVWNGSGKAITKTVSCAEIMKRKIKGLHQITKLRQRRIEELWEPKLEGLERLKVNRDIPAISILLSKDLLDVNEPGYQSPGSFDEFWRMKTQHSAKSGANRKKNFPAGESNLYRKKMRKMTEKQTVDGAGGDRARGEGQRSKGQQSAKSSFGQQSAKSSSTVKQSGDS